MPGRAEVNDRRLLRLRRRLARERADALVVVHRPNVLYLTGFTGDDAALLVTPQQAWLFTDGRFAVQSEQECGPQIERVIVSEPLLTAVGRQVRSQRSLRRVFIEAARLSVAQQDQLAAAGGRRVQWGKAIGWVERLRMTKEPEEIERIRQAVRVSEQVFREILPLIRPGVTELDLAAEIVYRMRRHGADGEAFPTIVAAGRHAALPHARPARNRLRANELVVLDLGAILGHYCSDLTRTVCLGRATAELRRLYRAVRRAQQAACQAVRPGVPAAAVDRAARQVLAKEGLERWFVHSTGHGIGLEIHEEPRLGRRQRQRLQPGMVVTIEPGVYEPRIGGIRIEDDVVVTDEGAEVLTTLPRDLLEL